MLILKIKFVFVANLIPTNENYSYLCDIISLLDMLQELKIKNFKSFRDEVVLSFETSGNDTMVFSCYASLWYWVPMPAASRTCLKPSTSYGYSGIRFR